MLYDLQTTHAHQNLLPNQGEVFYFPAFFKKEHSDHYFEMLSSELNWKQEPIKIFGKTVMQPRLTAWFGSKDYSYSGITMRANPFNKMLLEMKDRVERSTSASFNSALLNLYRDGNDSMGWHRDNEKMLGPKPVIASLSLGATRQFFLRNYRDKQQKINIELENGSLLLMRGDTQHYWEHSLAKTSKNIGPRINITFRYVV
ncbi:MAG: alpha-ketoglutarate-dependent dioxygenase AlkB [Bacteroidota bacterium]